MSRISLAHVQVNRYLRLTHTNLSQRVFSISLTSFYPCFFISIFFILSFFFPTGKMRELLNNGVVPIYQMIKDGEVDGDRFFGGPLSRHAQGIGTNPKEGEWNDVRDDAQWDDDVDCAQAGQAIGGITSVVSAGSLVKSMMEELIQVFQKFGGFANRSPGVIDVGKVDTTVLTLNSFL